ncbi:MAG: hypothetical protein LUC93_05370 [Planctomycetaceae bacterium]|nr:hypothetical protein [Planctomycetaceae bacterium]
MNDTSGGTNDMNDSNDSNDKPALASEMERQGAEWQDMGELGKALSCYRKALRLWRELAADAPEQYRGKLYDNLLALGYFRIIMGETDEGIGHWEEMLVINRSLVDSGELTESTLAYNLSMYGFMLERVRRIRESLDAHLEALDYYRRLAREDSTYLSALAKCLNTVGSRFAGLNRVREGIRFAHEALTCIALQPELHSEERVSCLSDFLFNLAGMYRRLDEGDHAIALCEEAVEGARGLASSGALGAQVLLAGNLERLAVFLIREGRHTDALAPIDESVALFTRLAAMSPADYASRLAGAQLTRGELFARMEDAGEAFASFQAAADGYGRLAQEDGYAFTGKFLTSLCRLGAAASQTGQREVVHETYAKALQTENRYIRRFGLTFAPFVEDSFESLL